MDAHKFMEFGGAILITLALVAAAIFIKQISMPAIEKGASQITQMTREMDRSNMMSYDNKTIDGNMAINAINRYAKEDFSVTIKTNKGSKTYNNYNGYEATSVKDADYINPAGEFKSKIDVDENGSLTGITIEQVKGSKGSH